MKFILLLPFFLFSCASYGAEDLDAGLKIINIENEVQLMKITYMPKCVRLCYQHTGSRDCFSKCHDDFNIITNVMIKAIKENNLKDFFDMMDSWWNCDN